MGELRVHDFSISLDGYAAGPAQDVGQPLDVGGMGGGVATVQQYLRADLLDELHLVVVPVLLGCGERLFENLGDSLDGWRGVESAPSRALLRVRLRRGAADFDTMEA
jgi:hypothetical protein